MTKYQFEGSLEGCKPGNDNVNTGTGIRSCPLLKEGGFKFRILYSPTKAQ